MDKDQPATENAPKPAHSAPAHENKPSNGLAIAAMVVGIIAIVLGWVIGLGFIMGIIALVLGIIGLKHKHNGGKGMAITGIVTGAIAIVWSIIATVLFILAMFTLGTVATTAERAVTEYNATNAAKVAAKKTFSEGETAIFDKFSVKVNSVTRNYVPTETYYGASTGKELIVVNVTVKNISNESEYFTDYDLKMNDAGISGTSNWQTLAPDFEGGDMSPNATETGNIIYEVTSGSTDLKLQYTTYGYELGDTSIRTLTYTLAI